MTEVIPTRTKRIEHGSLGVLPMPVRPSLGVSGDANIIAESLDAIERRQFRASASPTPSRRPGVAAKTLAEELYDSLANAKVLTARVAMHLEDDWRSRLFAQLDDLLDVDDWHEGDKPVEGSSFETFLRAIIFQGVKRRPGLGVSNRGNLIAAWTRGKDRLTLEFFPDNMVRWMLSCEIDGELERAAGETPVRRLPEVLGAYRPDRWFSYDGN